MTPMISAILVGILRAVGWQKLVVQVFEDMAYLAAKKISNEAMQKIAGRVGDALKEVDSKL